MIFLVILFFVIIGLMRVVQKVCSKTVSNQIEGKNFFHYGGYYQLVAAVLSLLALVYYGFSGFNLTMVLCSIGTAAFITLAVFTEIEALKGASLIVVQMFQAGAIILSALYGQFSGQPLNVFQWIGMAVFLVSIYFMVAQDKTELEEKPKTKISLKTWIMLILMFVGEGGTMIVQTIFATRVENGNIALFSFVMFAINALVLYICYLVQTLIRKPKKAVELGADALEEKKEGKWHPLSKVLLICGAFLGFALVVINILAVELNKMAPAALVFSISNAIAIIVTMLVGGIVYKEKVNVKNIIGIVLCAAALTVIGVFM